MHRTFTIIITIVGTSFLLMIGCTTPAHKKEVTPAQQLTAYNFSAPEKFFMPESLVEISGIDFYKGNSDTIYAIQDEEGKLFRLAWREKKQYNTKFGKKGDYEDLAIIQEKVTVLKSNGKLYSFPFSERMFEETFNMQEAKNLLPEGEYEGMYGDDATGKIYIICKNCTQDDAQKNVTGYILQSGDTLRAAGNFKIDVTAIKAFTGGEVKRGFRPSALAKNPLTNEWFILSSVNKMLVITDSLWKVKNAVLLDPGVFHQPEGMRFDKTGNLYISNEGDKLNEGNILKFTLQKN